jgi:hypothetical protein
VRRLSMSAGTETSYLDRWGAKCRGPKSGTTRGRRADGARRRRYTSGRMPRNRSGRA